MSTNLQTDISKFLDSDAANRPTWRSEALLQQRSQERQWLCIAYQSTTHVVHQQGETSVIVHMVMPYKPGREEHDKCGRRAAGGGRRAAGGSRVLHTAGKNLRILFVLQFCNFGFSWQAQCDLRKDFCCIEFAFDLGITN